MFPQHSFIVSLSLLCLALCLVLVVFSCQLKRGSFFISFTPVCPPQQNLYPCSRYSAKAAEQHEKTVEHFFLYDGAKGL